MLFADDFVGVSDSGEELQKLIDVVHAYCCKWRLKSNVSMIHWLCSILRSIIMIMVYLLTEHSFVYNTQ